MPNFYVSEENGETIMEATPTDLKLLKASIKKGQPMEAEVIFVPGGREAMERALAERYAGHRCATNEKTEKTGLSPRETK